MQEQAGSYNITLYENKELSLSYSDANTIDSISNSGDIISLLNSDCATTELSYKFDHIRSGNNKLKYKNSISWKQIGLEESNLELINTLKHSIYGWVSLIEFYNNEMKIILNPFIHKSDSIDTNNSNHYNIEIENIIFGNRIYDYVEAEGVGAWIIEDTFIVQ